MFFMRYRVFLIVFLFFSIANLFAQDIPIGTWRDHLPYTDAISVSYGDNIVYCATNSAVFTYDKTDKSTEKLNLVNGLSDIGLSKIKFNPYNKKILIAYKNGNIDVLDNKQITNISFIKTSNVSGSKSINNIYFKNNIAYLSTDFGIVVLDMDRMEIAETYFFGPNGNAISTKAVTFDANNIYAATTQGVYFANKNSANLADFNAWSLIPELGTKSYSGIVYFSNRIFASSDSPNVGEDSIYYNDGGIWQTFLPSGFNIDNIATTTLSTSDDILVLNKQLSTIFYTTSLSVMDSVTLYNGVFSSYSDEVVLDEEQNYWFADNFGGLVKTKAGGSATEFIFPNGPNSSNSFALDVNNDDLWMVSGGYGIYLDHNIINQRINGLWANMPFNIKNAQGNNIVDLVSVAINPNNPSQVYAGSWSGGLLEFNNGTLSNIYTAQNSVLDSVFFGTTAVGTVEFDKDNNLWVTSSYSNNILAVKTPNNNWYNYSFPNYTDPTSLYVDMVIDNNNYKWIVNGVKNNIIIFDDNGTLDITSDDRTAFLPSTLNNPNLQGLNLLCIKEDLDGEIWLGTSEGVAVIYNPSDVFNQEIKAEQIYIQQDGNTEILLGTEIINTIAIDGANRKWFGTQNSGVYLMSSDGTKEILHFTTKNSPLFSDNILDIGINQKTGEVYFATAKGLISYKGTATDANNDFNNIFVYPNPVKPDFTGVIAIRGLMKNSDVKITDISGNIVFETKSLGGQAIWNGKNLNGNRVKSGVYMVFSASEDGNNKKAAKILFIN